MIRGAPDAPNPPYGGSEIFVWGLLVMDYSDHQRVKYFWKALDFKYHLGYPWGVPQPPDPLRPWTHIRGVWGGVSMRGLI